MDDNAGCGGLRETHPAKFHNVVSPEGHIPNMLEQNDSWEATGEKCNIDTLGSRKEAGSWVFEVFGLLFSFDHFFTDMRRLTAVSTADGEFNAKPGRTTTTTSAFWGYFPLFKRNDSRSILFIRFLLTEPFIFPLILIPSRFQPRSF